MYIFKLLSFLFVLFCGVVFAQNFQNINVLFLNENENQAASNAVDVIQKYLEQNPIYGVTSEIIRVNGSANDPLEFLEDVCSTYSNAFADGKGPHVVFDATKIGVISDIVKSFSRSLGVPTVSGSYILKDQNELWKDLNDKEDKYFLQVMPPGELIPQIVRKFVQYRNMENVVILHDHSIEIKQNGGTLFNNSTTRFIIVPLANGLEQIESYLNFNTNNFFVIGTMKLVKSIYEHMSPDNFKPNVAWYAVSLDANFRLELQYHNATITIVKPVTEARKRLQLAKLRTEFDLNVEPMITTGFYFDLGLRTILSVRDMLNNGEWPSNMSYLACDEFNGKNTPYRDMDLRRNFIQSSEAPSYGNFKFPPDPENPFNGKSFMAIEMDISIVKGGNNSDAKLTGKWMAGLNSPLLIFDETEMEKALPKKIYKAVTVVQPPFVMPNASAPKGYSGIAIDLMQMIAERCNFDYTIEEVPDKSFGKLNLTSGEWDGVTKLLAQKKADIGVGSMPIRVDRASVVDFTMPYYDLVGFQIMLKRPDVITSLFTFVTVLDGYVWLCIFGGFLATSILLWVYDLWSPYSYQNSVEKFKDDLDKRVFSIKESLWFSITSLTPQGGGEPPKNLSGRLVAMTWWIFGFILLTSYTANLAAFLTITGMDQPPETLEELMRQFKIDFAPLNNSETMDYFVRLVDIEERYYELWKDMTLNKSLSQYQRSQWAVWEYPVGDMYTKLHQKFVYNRPPGSMEEAVARVIATNETDGFSLIGDATDIRYQAMQNCRVRAGSGNEFSRRSYGFALQLGSPLTALFNEALTTLLMDREMEKLKEKWWENETFQRCQEPLDPSMGITLANIGGVFMIILLGIGMSCCAMLFEIWWHKYRHKPKIVVIAEAPTPETDNVSDDLGSRSKGEF